MSQKPMNIKEQLDHLRSETASPEARRRTVHTIQERPRLGNVARWRWVAVTGTCALLTVPMFLNKPAGLSYARGFQQTIEATKEAPIIHEVTTVTYKGKMGKPSESWMSGNLLSRKMGNPEGIIFEYRVGKNKIFWHYSNPEYETVTDRTDKSWPLNSDGKNSYSLEKLLSQQSGNEVLEKKEVDWNGHKVTRYTMRSKELAAMAKNRTWKYPESKRFIYADPATNRIVGTEMPDSVGGGYLFKSVIDYPESVDSSIFEPPPKSSIPRFDIDAERVRIKAAAAKPRTVTLRGESIKVLVAVQSPGGTLGVIWQGNPMGADAAHRIEIDGATTCTMGYKIRTKTPAITGSWIAKTSKRKTIDLELPVHRNGKFLGYARFKNFPVQQSLPMWEFGNMFK